MVAGKLSPNLLTTSEFSRLYSIDSQFLAPRFYSFLDPSLPGVTYSFFSLFDEYAPFVFYDLGGFLLTVECFNFSISRNCYLILLVDQLSSNSICSRFFFSLMILPSASSSLFLKTCSRASSVFLSCST